MIDDLFKDAKKNLKKKVEEASKHKIEMEKVEEE